jgi:hypothetical protein
MSCRDCYKLIQIYNTINKNYCSKKRTIIENTQYNEEHSECCVCDGRKDGNINENFLTDKG